MDPAFTRARSDTSLDSLLQISQDSDRPSSQSQYAPPRNRTYDRMIERLLLPELNQVDQAFIEYGIIPRIVICSTSGLVYSAFGIEPTEFSAQGARSARSSWPSSASSHVRRGLQATGRGKDGRLGLTTRAICECHIPSVGHSRGRMRHHDDTAYLLVLDNEGCRIAIISDCWGEGFGELASVLSVLLGLDVYSAGLSPLLRYACDLETGIAPVALCTRFLRPSELEADAPLVGRTVEFIAEEPVRLIDSTVANGSSVFGRSTVTFQLTRPSLVTCSPAVSTDYLEPSFVVKIQLTTQDFVGREADVLNKIVERCAAEASSASAQLIKRHVALPEKAKSLGRHRSQMEDSALPILLDSEDSEQRLRDLPRHTLDVVVVRNPTPLPAPLDDARAQQRTLVQFCHVFDQLLTLLPALFDLGIHHRDLSIGNILQYQGHLVLVDWETGIVAQPGEQVPVAAKDADSIRFTRATVSWEVRSWLLLGAQFSRLPSHALHHDFESAVYWFLFVLDEFVGNCFSADLWIDLDLRPRGRDQRRRLVFPMDLARTELWGNGEYPNMHKLFLKDFEKLGPEMHGFVERMMCTLPFDLGSRGASEAEVAVANKQKMAAVQAELREILEVVSRLGTPRASAFPA